MDRFLLVFAMIIMPAIASAENIYKCTGKDGKVEYRQTPCEAGKVEAGKIQTVPTTPREQAQAKTNLQSYRDELQRRNAVDRANLDPPGPEAQGDTQQRISLRYDERVRLENLKQTLNSPSTSAEKKQAAKREMDAIESGLDRRLTYEDRIRRDNEVRSTSSIDAQTRERAANRAKDIQDRYLTPQERAQMSAEDAARAKTAEDTDLARKKASSVRANADATPPIRGRAGPIPTIVMNCDAGGCWDNTGNRYNRGGGSTYFRSDGRICQQVANAMQCN